LKAVLPQRKGKTPAAGFRAANGSRDAFRQIQASGKRSASLSKRQKLKPGALSGLSPFAPPADRAVFSTGRLKPFRP